MMNDKNEVNEFWNIFNTRLNVLKKQLNDENLTDNLKLQNPMDGVYDARAILVQVKSDVNQLQKLSTDASLILPLYDVKRTQEEIEACFKKIRQIELILNPKKKFTFTRLRNKETTNHHHHPKSVHAQFNNNTTGIDISSNDIHIPSNGTNEKNSDGHTDDRKNDNIMMNNNHDKNSANKNDDDGKDDEGKLEEGSYVIHHKHNETILLTSHDLSIYNQNNNCNNHSNSNLINNDSSSSNSSNNNKSTGGSSSGGSNGSYNNSKNTTTTTSTATAATTTTNINTAMAFRLYINECTNTLISIQSIIGSVRLENNSHCTILLGPCCTANYLENCHHCIIYMISHQLRIHNCHDCKLHVLVNSHPIMEDCQNLIFYQNKYFYSKLSHDLDTSGLTHATCWDNVIDFRWHKSVASPHWRAIHDDDDDDDDENTKTTDRQLAPVFEQAGWSLVYTGDKPVNHSNSVNPIQSAESIHTVNDDDDEM